MPNLGSLLPPHRRLVPGLVVALLGTATVAGVLLPFRSGLDAGAAGLALVVPVVIATAVGGATASVVAVVAGFLLFNLLFTEPYYTLSVTHVPDVVAIVVYVVVGAVTASIVSLRQDEASLARQREREAVTMFDLSRSLISEADLDDVLDGVVTSILRLFAAESAAVFVSDDEAGLRLVASAGGPLPDDAVERFRRSGAKAEAPRSLLETQLEVFPLLAGGGLRGLLVVAGEVPDGGRRVLTAFANHAALAVHRSELAQAATRVEVLEATDRVRMSLLRAVSHDLRTPLASITAAAEDLADGSLPLATADRRILLATIGEEAGRLDRLVANLLEMSRLESGHLELRREAVDVTELVESAMTGGWAGEVVVDVPSGLPPAHVDPVLIEQVFRNLLDNARRFSPPGVPIRVRGRATSAGLEIAVSDRGPGVAESDRERIFDWFSRIDAPSTAPGGMGLGLAIARGYLAAHGGDIRLGESDGGGATFVITLPAAGPTPDQADGALAGRSS